jgi:hypothetical protein
MNSTARKCVAAFALVLALVSAAGFGYAQGREDTNAVRPLVYSGADIGFRVDGRKGNAVVGRLVVRLDENGLLLKTFRVRG